MNGATLESALAQFLNTMNNAVNAGGEALPGIVMLAGRYLQVMNIAYIGMGVVCGIIGLILFRYARNILEKDEKQLKDTGLFKVASFSMVASFITSAIFTIIFCVNALSPSHWAGAVDPRVALVGYALEKVGTNRR